MRAPNEQRSQDRGLRAQERSGAGARHVLRSSSLCGEQRRFTRLHRGQHTAFSGKRANLAKPGYAVQYRDPQFGHRFTHACTAGPRTTRCNPGQREGGHGEQKAHNSGQLHIHATEQNQQDRQQYHGTYQRQQNAHIDHVLGLHIAHQPRQHVAAAAQAKAPRHAQGDAMKEPDPQIRECTEQRVVSGQPFKVAKYHAQGAKHLQQQRDRQNRAAGKHGASRAGQRHRHQRAKQRDDQPEYEPACLPAPKCYHPPERRHAAPRVCIRRPLRRSIRRPPQALFQA